jgi:LysM repeat protein
MFTLFIGLFAFLAAALPAPHPSYSYIVRSGDYGLEIAEAHGISWPLLASANPGVNWYNLQIGQNIQIPSRSGSSRDGNSGGALQVVPIT